MKSIILVGFMACGKSTLGIEVANNFNLDFFDTDKIITYVYNATISDIFYKYGQEHFIECEFNVINSLINKKCVISIGGAGFIREKTFNLIKKDLISIYIKVSVKALYNRLKQNNDYKNRPNIIPIFEYKQKNLIIKKLAEMLEEREKWYCQADFIIQIEDNESIDQGSQKIKMLLKNIFNI